MKAIYNDIQRIETSLLLSMYSAYSADYGRLLTAEETIERKNAMILLQVEIESRQQTTSNSNQKNKQ
jgi:hypothetical protein